MTDHWWNKCKARTWEEILYQEGTSGGKEVRGARVSARQHPRSDNKKGLKKKFRKCFAK